MSQTYENVRAGDFYLGYAADIADGADEAASAAKIAYPIAFRRFRYL